MQRGHDHHSVVPLAGGNRPLSARPSPGNSDTVIPARSGNTGLAVASAAVITSNNDLASPRVVSSTITVESAQSSPQLVDAFGNPEGWDKGMNDTTLYSSDDDTGYSPYYNAGARFPNSASAASNTGGSTGNSRAQVILGSHGNISVGTGEDLCGEPITDSDSDVGFGDLHPGSPHRNPDNAAQRQKLQKRASQLAFSNSLDLRPATAAAGTSGLMASHTPRGRSIVDLEQDHHLIKQVDLGGLSAALFTPSTESQQIMQSSSTGINTPPGSASSPDVSTRLTGLRAERSGGLLTAAPSSVPLPAPGVSPTVLAAPPLASPSGASASGALSSAGGPGGVAAAGGFATAQPQLHRQGSQRSSLPGAVAMISASSAATGAGGSAGNVPSIGARPASGNAKWGSSRGAGGPAGGSATATVSNTSAPSPAPTAGPSSVSMAALEAAAAAARAQLAEASQHMVRPPTRQVQSARPMGLRGGGQELELDASVWEANIAMQLKRPPSRQKPPPEALHLWTADQQFGIGGQVGMGNMGQRTGRPMRPASAMPTTYRVSRPQSGPRQQRGVATGMQGDVPSPGVRPPTRQKPPPMSLVLEHPAAEAAALAAMSSPSGRGGGTSTTTSGPGLGARPKQQVASQLTVVMSESDSETEY